MSRTRQPSRPRRRPAPRVAGLVLAAGGSSRMGTAKALLDAGGMTFVGRLVQTLAGAGCDPVVVVAPARAGGVANEATRTGARLVVNPDGAGGQIGSLRAGLEWLAQSADPPAAVMFTPVDNPAVAPATVEALITAWRAARAARSARTAIVLPRWGNRRGHPVLADMRIAHEFHEPGLPEGARTVVRRDPGRVMEVEVEDPGALEDIDTPERYRRRFLQEPSPGPALPGPSSGRTPSVPSSRPRSPAGTPGEPA